MKIVLCRRSYFNEIWEFPNHYRFTDLTSDGRFSKEDIPEMIKVLQKFLDTYCCDVCEKAKI